MHQLTRNQLTAVFGFIRAERQLFDLDRLASTFDMRRIELGDLLTPSGFHADFVNELEPYQCQALIAFGKRFGVITEGNEYTVEPLKYEMTLGRDEAGLFAQDERFAEHVKRDVANCIANQLFSIGAVEFGELGPPDINRRRKLTGTLMIAKRNT